MWPFRMKLARQSHENVAEPANFGDGGYLRGYLEDIHKKELLFLALAGRYKLRTSDNAKFLVTGMRRGLAVLPVGNTPNSSARMCEEGCVRCVS